MKESFKNRLRIKIVGASGSGLLSAGHLLNEALMELGYFTVSDRDYPSVIKGGHANFTLNIATEPIFATSEQADIMIMVDRPGLEEYHWQLKDGGILIHAYDTWRGLGEISEALAARGCHRFGLAGRQVMEELGGSVVMINSLVLGLFWGVMHWDLAVLEEKIQAQFAKKPAVIPKNLEVARYGYQAIASQLQMWEQKVESQSSDLSLTPNFEALKAELSTLSSFPKATPHSQKMVLLNGNQTIALGAVHAGVRAYFAYPMSPASSILTYMSQYALKKGLVVKQAEDEITASQMCLGAMWMGTRAFTATSGGGFDLMTETVSLAGITEVPLVIVDAQRPGPATGLPTWTCQADLHLAIHAGHGEFAKVVLACSDATQAFDLIQHAFNIAEKYQAVVIVLTEKQIAEMHWSLPRLEQGKIPVERGLVQGADLESIRGEDRYALAENGVSKRWIPGSSEAYYFANGDEHWLDGTLTEDADEAHEMIAKRIRKIQTIQDEMPEPTLYGPEKADYSFVAWGSTKTLLLDAQRELEAQGKTLNFLHFEVVWPLKTEALKKFFDANEKVHMIELNATGQLASLIEAQGFSFAGKCLKWNGRPFYLEDFFDYIETL